MKHIAYLKITNNVPSIHIDILYIMVTFITIKPRGKRCQEGENPGWPERQVEQDLGGPRESAEGCPEDLQLCRGPCKTNNNYTYTAIRTCKIFCTCAEIG